MLLQPSGTDIFVFITTLVQVLILFFWFRLMEYEYYYNLQEQAACITYRYSKKKRDQQKSVSNLFIAAFSTRKLFPFYNIHDPRIHLFSSRISKQIWQPQPEWNTQNLVHQLHILLYIRIYRFVMLLQTGCIL